MQEVRHGLSCGEAFFTASQSVGSVPWDQQNSSKSSGNISSMSMIPTGRGSKS